MTYQFSISDIGLRLIKAYEGFYARPVKLKDGQLMVGFGHHLPAGENLTLDENEAEELLKQDLEPVQAFLNRYVHAGMTQSQFDALCSLVYTIGAKAFLNSSVLHSLNQGKIIDAANGFDEWRFATIAGKTYMVDALVRRRTAEKALFLRPAIRTPQAARYDVTPLRKGQVGREGSPVWGKNTEATETESFDTQSVQARMRETRIYADVDRPDVGMSNKVTDDILPLTDIVSEDFALEDEISKKNEVSMISLVNLVPDLHDDGAAKGEKSQQGTIDVDIASADLSGVRTGNIESDKLESGSKVLDRALDMPQLVLTQDAAGPNDAPSPSADPSPIAEAAAQVSARLDALMGREEPVDSGRDWPDSLVDGPVADNIVNLHAPSNERNADIVIDELESDDAMRSVRTSSSDGGPYYFDKEYAIGSSGRGIWAYVTMIVIGLTLVIGGVAINLKGSFDMLGTYGPFVSVGAVMLGTLLFLMGIYHFCKVIFKINN